MSLPSLATLPVSIDAKRDASLTEEEKCAAMASQRRRFGIGMEDPFVPLKSLFVINEKVWEDHFHPSWGMMVKYIKVTRIGILMPDWITDSLIDGLERITASWEGPPTAIYSSVDRYTGVAKDLKDYDSLVRCARSYAVVARITLGFHSYVGTATLADGTVLTRETVFGQFQQLFEESLDGVLIGRIKLEYEIPQ